MSGTHVYATRSRSAERMARPGESFRQGLSHARVQLQRMNMLSMPAPPAEEDNLSLISPHTDPPPFNLADEFTQEEYSDTMSTRLDERYENFDREGVNRPTSAQSTFREDTVQEQDPSDVIGLGFPTLTDTSTAETVIE